MKGRVYDAHISRCNTKRQRTDWPRMGYRSCEIDGKRKATFSFVQAHLRNAFLHSLGRHLLVLADALGQNAIEVDVLKWLDEMGFVTVPQADMIDFNCFAISRTPDPTHPPRPICHQHLPKHDI